MHSFSRKIISRGSIQKTEKTEDYTENLKLPLVNQTLQGSSQHKNLNSLHFLQNRNTQRNVSQTQHKQQPLGQLCKSTSTSIQRKFIPQILDYYTIQGVIGKGSYASVMSAISNCDNDRVAIKVYEKLNLYDPMKKKNVQREIEILKSLNHPNIIKLIKTVETSTQLNLVMEYGGNISVQDYVKSHGGRLQEQDAKYIMKQVISAVAYLHSKGVVHRDIKLENILLDNEKQVKLIDFGFAIIPENGSRIKVFCGTPSYMAPEITSKSISYSTGVDVWACGIILFYLLNGVLPFKAQNERELYKRIQAGVFKKTNFDALGAQNLIEKLLQINQSLRISAENVQKLIIFVQALKDTWITPIIISDQIQELKRFQLSIQSKKIIN